VLGIYTKTKDNMLKSKTVWTGIVAIVGAIGGFFTGDLELGAMLQLVVSSGLAIFLRHGIKKAEDA
jgi:hypothetical protein